MYILQNAFQNVLRNRGRNILIGVIIFAIIATTVVALIINNTSDAIIQNYKDKFGSEVIISADFEKIRAEAQADSENGMMRLQMPSLPAEQQLAFTQSEHLKESVATGTVFAESDGIVAIDHQEDDGEDGDTGAFPGGGMTMGGNGGTAVLRMAGGMGDFKLQGDVWTEFTEGTRALLDDGVSAMPSDTNECLVSEDLAAANGISVGDVLTFTAEMSVDFDTEEYPDLAEGDTLTLSGIDYTVGESFMGGRATREVVYTLTVSGIYSDLTDEYPNGMSGFQMAGMNRRNEILTTLDALLECREINENGVTVDVKYYLKSPDLLEAFEADARAMGLSDMFAVTTDSASYDAVVKPVLGLKGISITFMIVVLILGAVILLLLSSIAIRERKYEIGVLRAMGMKKNKVALGLLSEMLMITCLCLVAGLAVGAAAAQPVADVLIEQQAEAQQDDGFLRGGQMQTVGGGFTAGRAVSGRIFGGSQSNAQPLDEINLSIDAVTILEIIGISVLMASLAALAAVVKITKYEPIKILMERS